MISTRADAVDVDRRYRRGPAHDVDCQICEEFAATTEVLALDCCLIVCGDCEEDAVQQAITAAEDAGDRHVHVTVEITLPEAVQAVAA